MHLGNKKDPTYVQASKRSSDVGRISRKAAQSAIPSFGAKRRWMNGVMVARAENFPPLPMPQRLHVILRGAVRRSRSKP
jgi:hypothetical protein